MAQYRKSPSHILFDRSPFRRNSNSAFQVSEVFKSVQGEGPHTGRPSVFLRLGICNLSCVWCDTPYTWLFSKDRLDMVRKRAEKANFKELPPAIFEKKKEFEKRSLDQLYADVTHTAGNSIRAIVITGGEPLLHKKPLLHIVPRFVQDRFQIEFETNGTLSPDGLPSSVHLNVSPKLSNSLVPREQRLKFNILQQCMSFRSAILKFVVSNEQDIEEVIEIVNTIGVDPGRVFLMPQGTVSFPIFLHL